MGYGILGFILLRCITVYFAIFPCFVSYYCDTVDGYWAEWYEWQQCNVTCAGGVQLRTRDCVEPLHGGLNCTGDDTESQICNENPCPGECVSRV